MKSKWLLQIFTFSTLILACGEGANDIPLTLLEQHVKYQDNQLKKDGSYPDELIKEYGFIVEANVSSAEAHYLLGRIDRSNSDRHYVRSLEINSKFYPSLIGLAEFYCANEPSKSLEYAKKSIESNADDWKGYYWAGMAYSRMFEDSERPSDKRSLLGKAFKMFDKSWSFPTSDTLLIRLKMDEISMESTGDSGIQNDNLSGSEEFNDLTSPVGLWLNETAEYRWRIVINADGSYYDSGVEFLDYLSGTIVTDVVGKSQGSWTGGPNDLQLFLDGIFFVTSGKLIEGGKKLQLKGPQGQDVIFKRVH